MYNHSEYAEKALDDIFNSLDKIHLGCLTILTGENGTGKSLIRKCIASHLKSQYPDEHVQVAMMSMDNRTGLNTGNDAICFTRDLDWTCTSGNSIHLLKSFLNSVTNRYLVIDEPEVGMSDSLKMSVGQWFTKKFPEVLGNNKGILLITHSKEIVRKLKTVEHVFINIQGKDEETWLNEEPSEIDLDEFEKKNNELFHILTEHLK